MMIMTVIPEAFPVAERVFQAPAVTIKRVYKNGSVSGGFRKLSRFLYTVNLHQNCTIWHINTLKKYSNVLIKIQYIGKMHKRNRRDTGFIERKCNCNLQQVCYNFH